MTVNDRVWVACYWQKFSGRGVNPPVRLRTAVATSRLLLPRGS